MFNTRAIPAALLLTGALAAPATPAAAQLREPQVLLIYDSRIGNSLSLAEFYAGSAKVPGGTGAIAGVHPRVRVLDLSTRPAVGAAGQAGAFPQQPDIDYTTFVTRFRDPLRVYLAQPDPLAPPLPPPPPPFLPVKRTIASAVRCILLTTGIPHRIQNISNAAPLSTTIGDNPAGINNAFNNNVSGNFTYCSLDSELTLLEQSLDAGEAGAQADSRADGMIINPYARVANPIGAYSTRNILTGKLWGQPGPPFNGLYWLNFPPPQATALTPGDLYLVCRIDGNTPADSRNIITRAQNLAIPMATARILLDSDGSTIDGSNDPPLIDAGPDYARTSALLAADGRFPPANILFNTSGNFTQFAVGPHISYAAASNGPPIVISDPLILMASFGSNHSGVNGNGTSAGTTYAQSFNYLPGAVFNSLESYNGRSFGGIGGNPFVPQQQAADALADQTSPARIGATFAIGNAWEPFSFSVADNEQIARNFLLGNMSWAEAAYTSLPVLSWQQLVIGDPLARPRRDREDRTADGRITIDDLYAFRQSPVDLNNSGGTPDEADFALLELSVRAFEAVNMKAEQR